MTGVRAILFDADGVIQHGNTGRFMAIARAVFGREGDGFRQFMAAVFECEQPSLSGDGDFTEALARLLSDWACAGSVQDFLAAWEAIDVVPGALDLVTSLRSEGYLCGLATNQQTYRRRYMSEVLGYRHAFDREFYSCDLGFRKPEPRYFECIVEELALTPGTIAFIDDSAANVEAARALGLQVALHEGGSLRDTVQALLSPATESATMAAPGKGNEGAP